MIGDIVGMVLVKESTEFSQNFFGDIKEIAGKTLRVLEKNEEGDCLCIGPDGKYLVDIDNKDVRFYTPFPSDYNFNKCLKILVKTLQSRG